MIDAFQPSNGSTCYGLKTANNWFSLAKSSFLFNGAFQTPQILDISHIKHKYFFLDI